MVDNSDKHTRVGALRQLNIFAFCRNLLLGTCNERNRVTRRTCTVFVADPAWTCPEQPPLSFTGAM